MLGRLVNYLSTFIHHPNRVGRELNRRYYRKRGNISFNEKGVNYFDEDWDNLLLLDACRYDLFKSEHDLPGELTYKYSLGSCTPEFIEANLQRKTLHDTVYISANPMYHQNSDQIDLQMHAVFDLWEDDWNSDHRTVLPETVTERTIELIEQFPHKRLFVHYIQPHYPFIGTNIEWDRVNPDEYDMWRKRMNGELAINATDIWPAYRGNLRRALPSIERAMVTLRGKTVVTSDHGNMIGERSSPIPVREWGHPPGIYTDELVKVPWLEYTNKSRRTITSDPPVDKSFAPAETVQDRLEKLGYTN